MFRRLFSRDELSIRAEVMRRVHSDWLTKALRARSGITPPRIPTRLVSAGGFGPEMATDEGRARAAGFWATVLEDLEPA